MGGGIVQEHGRSNGLVLQLLIASPALEAFLMVDESLLQEICSLWSSGLDEGAFHLQAAVMALDVTSNGWKGEWDKDSMVYFSVTKMKMAGER